MPGRQLLLTSAKNSPGTTRTSGAEISCGSSSSTGLGKKKGYTYIHNEILLGNGERI